MADTSHGKFYQFHDRVVDHLTVDRDELIAYIERFPTAMEDGQKFAAAIQQDYPVLFAVYAIANMIDSEDGDYE